MAAAQAKTSTNRGGNKENPAQSPLRQKGSSKKAAAAVFADENAPVSTPFAASAADSSAHSTKKLAAKGKGVMVSEQPLAKAKQLFGDATSATTNIKATIPTTSASESNDVGSSSSFEPAADDNS